MANFMKLFGLTSNGYKNVMIGCLIVIAIIILFVFVIGDSSLWDKIKWGIGIVLLAAVAFNSFKAYKYEKRYEDFVAEQMNQKNS